MPLVDIDVSLSALEQIPGRQLQGVTSTKRTTWYRHTPISEAPTPAHFHLMTDSGALGAFTFKQRGFSPQRDKREY